MKTEMQNKYILTTETQRTQRSQGEIEEKINFETWLQNIVKRPLPPSRMLRLQTLAKEIAEGALEHYWEVQIEVDTTTPSIYIPKSQTLQAYLRERWQKDDLDSGLLHSTKYLDGHRITEKAFNLLIENIPASIFISYKRSESSAFAMYVLTRLKQEGIKAFVDMELMPGEDWHAGLEKRIKNQEYDYFITLIGKETLKSEVCIKEIGWAIEAGLEIIPVWHNKFKFVSNKWNLKPEIASTIEKKHAIQVKEESASGYNTAMVELLNRFGITP